MQPIPKSLEESPIGSVPPPTHTRPQELPFEQLTWENFERLCLRLVRLEAKVEHCQLYGERGDDQEGIDLFAKKSDADKYTVYQCKQVKNFGPTKIKNAVSKFLDGEWVERTDMLVLCTQESLNARQRADEIVKQIDLLQKRGLKFTTWDGPALSAKLKNQHKLVEDFFGDAWATEFCGQIAPKNRMLEAKVEKALLAYMGDSFQEDLYAELDQAGETDPSRKTLLKKVFVDLNVVKRKHPSMDDEPFRKRSKKYGLGFFADDELSAMDTLLSEKEHKFVIIGGPGQGKSTLGQYLVQIHRASFLKKDWEVTPELPRTPFKVILKLFAQWLSNRTDDAGLDEYLAELVSKKARIPISGEDIQLVFGAKPCLLFLDGLDEVMSPQTREKTLMEIKRFVQRSELLEYDIYILATSRPRGYGNDFDPKQFTHLHLLPLTPEKAINFASKWTDAKFLPSEEKDHLLTMFQECQNDRNLSNLLHTPLQVNIILLIIKGGGRPPSQREALYDEYWKTIYRREKGKAKGIAEIIKSDEPLLLGLHANLAYILHQRAAKTNVQSLLSEPDFRDSVRDFLRTGDRYSSDKAIEERVSQIVVEARDRLMLIVEPEPGLFGFEVRQFQEFFASLHLAMTAQDTQQRVKRLRVLARSEHWHSVALFMAGRIVRVNGELAHLIPEACKPADREGIYRYRRPGTWMAMEIAADGICGVTQRNQQYSMIEYGCELLETGMSFGQRDEFESLIRQLPQQDKNDLLQPILTKYLRHLPLSRLPFALDIYASCYGVDPLVFEKLELLSTNETTSITALDLAFQHKADIKWMIPRIRDNWEWWKSSFQSQWEYSPNYVETILTNLNLQKDEIEELALQIINEGRYYRRRLTSEYKPSVILPRANSPIEQLITLLQCTQVIAKLDLRRISRRPQPVEKSGSCFSIALQSQDDTSQYHESFKSILPTIKQLLNQRDIADWLLLQAWTIYWHIGQPNSDEINQFLNLIRSFSKSDYIEQRYWSFVYRSQRPLLWLFIQRILEGKDVMLSDIMLSVQYQISISDRVIQAIKSKIDNIGTSELDDLSIALITYNRLQEFFPDIYQIAQDLGISIDDLVRHYVHVGINRESNSSLSKETILDVLENAVGLEFRPVAWILQGAPWPEDVHVYEKIGDFIRKNLAIFEEPNSDMPVWNIHRLIHLFAKLTQYHSLDQELAQHIFKTLAHTNDDNHRIYFMDKLGDISSLLPLKSYLKHKDETIRVGAIRFWIRLTNNLRRHPVDIAPDADGLPKICFDHEYVWTLINSEDTSLRQAGICFLTNSNLPIENSRERKKILNSIGLENLLDEDEQFWLTFLREAPVNNNLSDWLQLFEQILNEPQRYGADILDVSMERYMQLSGESAYLIPEADENELGLI